ncbi:MAG TPA: 50S ribosomal protein L24 [Xylella sp.]
MASRLRKGDQVIVIAGKEKGKRGEIVSVTDRRVIISNVNIMKRHTKPNPSLGVSGGVIDREAPVHVSNVQILNPSTGKPDRVGFKILDDGSKLRVFRSSGEAIGA